MYVQVKTVDGKTKMLADISKTMPVLDFKLKLETLLDIKKEKQRLFFRGKQLEEGYCLFDYNINMNDVIQVMEKPDLAELDKKVTQTDTVSVAKQEAEENDTLPKESLYFKVGDFVDLRDTIYGAWFEGKILAVCRDPEFNKDKATGSDAVEGSALVDDFLYKVFLTGEDDSLIDARLKDIRPRARKILPISSLKVGNKVMVNYNIENPKKRGYWYDFCIKEVKVKGKKELFGDLFIGNLTLAMSNVVVTFTDEIMEIPETVPLADRNESEASIEPNPRQTGDSTDNGFCDHCKINPKRKCKDCGCHVCGSKSDPDKQIMCDECDMAFHIWCVSPSMDRVPEVEEWFCSECKNDENEIVKAGDKLKTSKKKAKMASTLNQTNRDWGKGMACAGRTKECTLVPPNHFGPIPGVEVGTQWKFRVQVSESGVHRPHVAGIHGREGDGAYSIVLSGGYEDDVDNGDEFAYTGSGGRDLSGNKRTAIQSCDQTLTRMNKALALNCNAPLNTKKGAKAVDWQGGKPVRVVRNFKAAKHSKYAPEEGNRYDGIYKLVRYYPEKGKSGFIVWRYMFRRDDPIPPPWSDEGKKRIESLGLEMIYPEGFLEAMKAKEEAVNEKCDTPKTKRGSKRVLEESSEGQSTAKKQKVAKYKLSMELEKAIANDEINEKLWISCKDQLELGKPKFLACVEEAFTCICCMDLVCKPVTLACHHNVCFECIKRSFTADIKTCPHCREPVKSYTDVNENLKEALLELFPGYTAGRNCKQ